VIDQIVERADGVPLFIEELTRAVLRSELLPDTTGGHEPNGPIPPLAIPASLHDSLVARLDRLGPNREIAQVGAVIGREFSWRLIEAVAPFDRESLRAGLAQLVQADLLVQAGDADQAVYSFRHSLILDAAYESLLKGSRQLYHQRIALALEHNFPELAETQPELLARHHSEAGLPVRR
jgi:predicted ATPase